MKHTFSCFCALPWFMLFHFCVDFCCGASVIGVGLRHVSPRHAFVFITLYNFLAFCTQPLTGVLCDWRKNDRLFLGIALFTVFAGGASIHFCPWFSVVLLGMGNSLFHVSAGREVVRFSLNGDEKHHRIFPLGAFVGPGALGVGLGCLLAQQTYWIALACLGVFTVVGLWRLRQIPAFSEKDRSPMANDVSDSFFTELCMWLVIFCVFSRAATVCIAPPWTHNYLLSIVLFTIVVMGKVFGGYLAERIGWKRLGVLSLTATWILLHFFGGTVWGTMVGQFVANLMMAITLFLLAELYPRLPGTMFGAAAAVLFPGSLAKYLPNASSVFTFAYLIALICFLLVVWLWRRGKAPVSET